MNNQRQSTNALLIALAVFALWMIITQRIMPPPRPATRPTTTPAVATTAPREDGPAPTTEPASTGPTVGELTAGPAATVETIELGSIADNGEFPMHLKLTSRGAAVEDVRLRGFKLEVGRNDPYPLLSPVKDPVSGRWYGSFATHKVRIETLKKDILLDRLPWRIDRTASTDGAAVFRVVVEQDGRPVLEITKTYTLPKVGPLPKKGHETPASRRSDVVLDYSFRNRTAGPLDVILVQQGPMGMHREDSQRDERGLMAATEEAATVKTSKKYARGSVKPTRDAEGRIVHPTIELGKDHDKTILAWAAETNKYFCCIVRPDRDEKAPIGIAQAQALSLTDNESNTFSEDMTFELVTTPVRVEPNAAAAARFALYLGPKSKVAFDKVPEYARHGYFHVISVDLCCCTPAPIVSPMMWLLQALYWPTKNYGVAITLLVLIVRILLHPITKAQQVSMMKMQKNQARLRPKLEELKKKYANDRAKMNEEMMALYKEEGISPFAPTLTFLPMALQIPILGALWAALAYNVDMRHAPLDGYWIRDLAAPDALIRFSQPFDLPLIGGWVGTIRGFNLLPILLTITMYLQQKYMPKASSAPGPGQTDDQLAQQQKIMGFMTIFMGLMFYNMPSGLNFYWMAGNVVGLVEQWRIRKHIAELEERARNAPPKPEGSLKTKLRKPRFWEWLEKKAEEARKTPSRRDRD